MKIRKYLRTLHRDFGYFIVGMTIVYCLSGIFLNHRHDFNPDYKISSTNFKLEIDKKQSYSDEEIKQSIKSVQNDVVYKKHYINNEGEIRIFIENGEVVIDPDTGQGTMRYLKRRPLIFSMNKLHRSTLGTIWKWVSDVMGAILLFVAISGLFLLKGKRGLRRWGWWLTIVGFILPLTFMLLFI
ncbi:MAG TPA: PepSY-associated TM helix domain-containing protein [Draconibacterium sp.]|nr:PepSY-associated TM helix domain-containing protein [Draconibacterium sp.]